MSALGDVINERLVKLSLEGMTRETVIDQLAVFIKVEEKVSSKFEFVKGVFEREDVMTTYQG
jgi:mannitol/fructose-specific phosphotransferase system IIA component (Ntr-type)